VTKVTSRILQKVGVMKSETAVCYAGLLTSSLPQVSLSANLFLRVQLISSRRSSSIIQATISPQATKVVEWCSSRETRL
jgi:hypothetical protein